MKYLLSILCLFVLSCDSGGGDAGGFYLAWYADWQGSDPASADSAACGDYGDYSTYSSALASVLLQAFISASAV